ncbi:MAG: putative NRPS-like protein biosynthetic cluster [Bathelium mastoideum]|nr:MAG: putative NRPS-like protein biosynthetic cluster [Bathelium mastoideum]
MYPQNLTTVLLEASKAHPSNGLVFYPKGEIEGEGNTFTYAAFLERAEENAIRIHALGLESGTIVLLHFDSIQDNLEWFWAVTYAGYTPALSTPLSNNLEQRKKHLLNLHSLLDNPVCLTRTSLLGEFSSQNKLKLQTVEELPHLSIETPGFLKVHGFYAPINQGILKQHEDIAALMLTSGSTGLAKAVCLTHGTILAAVAGKSAKNTTSTYTPFFNWIGTDHVANLTEIHMQAMWVGATQIHAQATDIIVDPIQLLRLVDKHRIAYTFAPNFFLASLLRTLQSADTSGLNLSSLRSIISGGEANVIQTSLAISKLLQEKGAWPHVVKPAFGMTETCAGSIYNMDFPKYDLDQNTEFASLGSCVPGMQMRIVDDNGLPVDADVPGSLEVRGPNVFRKYYNNPTVTAESFNGPWFITGDQGRIDASGRLFLTGRAKETLIINGVSYSPQEIESALEDVEGAKRTFTVVFPYREKGSDTESLAVAYCPTYEPEDVAKRVATNDALSKATMLHIGAKPLLLPLDARVLQKTTLGKISRSKVRKSFEAGALQKYLDFNAEQTQALKVQQFEKPEGETEQMIFEVFKESFDLPEYHLGVNANLFEIGVNSMDLIRIKNKLQKQINAEIPVITLMTNPTIRTLAVALKELQKPHEYDPMVVLQGQGDKTPLWLIHPGVGEVLVFLNLAIYLADRPVYAMRARGFEKGEDFFTSIEEMVSMYVDKIRSVQPKGPYALAGYSYGSMVAFEISKRLKALDEEADIRFLGVFNLPPHIKTRMRQLDWTNCILNLSYFLDFFSEDDAMAMVPMLSKKSRQEVVDHIMSLAPKDRLNELGLDEQKLVTWADLAFSLQGAAVDYEPSGIVDRMDIFYAIPLAAVAKGLQDWKDNHLSKWQEYSKTAPRFYPVEGAHYTMLGPQHILSFQKTLKAALTARGL